MTANKKPAQMSGLFVGNLAFSIPSAEYGAADGTRTRDPRRDRPVF